MTKFDELWQAAGELPVEVDTEGALARLEAAMESDFGAGAKKVKSWGSWVAGVGALTIAAVLLAGASWRVFSSNTKDIKQEAYNTYATQRGQRASITLRDGSRVTLGPATTLTVSRSPGADDAVTVDVTGEALFHVTHASQRSFTVTSHEVVTRVLGTEFVVRAYDPSQVRVAVREGRISVKSPVFSQANAAVVTAGEAVLVTPNASPSVVPITDLATDFGWAEGNLVLRNVPLGEALVRLSRWYGIDFQVTEERKYEPGLFRQLADCALQN